MEEQRLFQAALLRTILDVVGYTEPEHFTYNDGDSSLHIKAQALSFVHSEDFEALIDKAGIERSADDVRRIIYHMDQIGVTERLKHMNAEQLFADYLEGAF